MAEIKDKLPTLESLKYVYEVLKNLIDNKVLPTKTSDLENDTGYITAADISASFSYDSEGNVSVMSLFSNSIITHDNNGNVVVRQAGGETHE